MRRRSWCRWRVLGLAVLLQFVTYTGTSAGQKAQPRDVVQKLYREIVLRHPMGVPHGAAKIAIWPLLSQRLIRALETRNACDLDWERRHRNADPPLKAPGFYEDGLFSGSDEQGYVNGVVVGSTKTQADGSYLVYVRLWSYLGTQNVALRTGKIYSWRVAALVTSQDGHFFVDDILGFKGVFDRDKPAYMSKMLASGCNGTHSAYN